jgi:hypothetical protein
VPRFSFLFRDAGLLDFGAPPIDAAIGMLSSSLLSSSTHRCLFAMRRNRKGKDKMMKAQKKLEERKEEARKKREETTKIKDERRNKHLPAAGFLTLLALVKAAAMGMLSALLSVKAQKNN